MMPSPAQDQLKAIRALIMDCDGVMTNGEIAYDIDAKRSLSFYARDGLGLALLCKSGIRAAVLSGRPADIAELRHKELGVEAFVGRCKDKAQGIIDLSQRMGIAPEEMAFIGDDLADLPAFRKVGLKIAVADAATELRDRADWITQAPGGRGAIREVCEALLKAQGKWDKILKALS